MTSCKLFKDVLITEKWPVVPESGIVLIVGKVQIVL